jgi:hypothetical protein
MAEKFKLQMPDGSTVTTNDPAAALMLQMNQGAVEAPRSTKVDGAIEAAKTSDKK